jgi:cell division initiation protein
MKLTSLDIRRQKFKKVFRGCDPGEVKAYLDVVAQALEELQKEQGDLRQKISELEIQLREYRTVEKAMQQTFMQAQETSTRAMENARKESQLIIQEAEMKASHLVEKARNELVNLREQLTILRAKKDSVITRLKMLLHSELDTVKALEVEEGMQAEDKAQLTFELSKENNEIDEIIKSLE